MIVCDPAVRTLVVKVAEPVASERPLASTVAPSENWTVPAVTGAPPAVTVAVNVTDWPTVDGLTLDARAVVVGFASTTWASEPLLAA